MICRKCQTDMDSPKKWGYTNICDDCDTHEDENRHVAVMIADGKTDYHFELIRHPTQAQAAKIRSIGLAHDPRTQLRFTGKGQHTDNSKKK
jgi:hypothetical protein